MPKQTRISPHDEWFIAHNNVDVFVFSFNPQGTTIETGQPFLEVFNNEEDWLARCAELDITPENEEE